MHPVVYFVFFIHTCSPAAATQPAGYFPLPAAYAHTDTDSLVHHARQKLARYPDSLQATATGKAEQLTANIPTSALPNTEAALPPVHELSPIEIPGNHLPELPEISPPSLSEHTLSLPEAPLPEVPAPEIPHLPDMAELPQSSQLAGKAPLPQMPAPPLNPASAKAPLPQMRAQVPTPFAGKEEQLKQAYAKMQACKNKYTRLESVKDLELRPDTLHRRKRWQPGALVQYHTGPTALDAGPVVHYKINDRLAFGAGLSYRLYMQAPLTGGSRAVYGGRAIGEYSIKKGFALRGEYELLSTEINPLTDAGPALRMWVPGVFTGISKAFKVKARLYATSMIMLNLLHDYRSPYTSEVQVRMGLYWKPRQENP